LKRVAVQDVSGAYPHFYGLLLWDSDGNHIENGTVRNSGTGIQLRNSSGNRIEQNRVSGNSYYNVSLTGDSDQNVVLRNQVDQGGDGIYVGCCDVVPHFGPQRTIGADNNLVRGNAVSGNSRFGVAEVVGNIGSMFRNNTSSGNGVADSWPPAPLSELRSRSLEHRWAQERYRACAEAWWRGIDTEARAYQWLDPVPELVQETEELQQYVADNCSGVGAALAGVPGAAQAWCDDVSRVLGSLSKLFWPPFIQYAAVELQGFVAKANC
jgi:parallel beta-helix repeat protein